MDTTQQKIDELAGQITTLQKQITKISTLADEILKQHQRLLSWTDLYDTVSPEKNR